MCLYSIITPGRKEILILYHKLICVIKMFDEKNFHGSVSSTIIFNIEFPNSYFSFTLTHLDLVFRLNTFHRSNKESLKLSSLQIWSHCALVTIGEWLSVCQIHQCFPLKIFWCMVYITICTCECITIMIWCVKVPCFE